MKILHYAAAPEEKTELERTCDSWSFWSYNEISYMLKRSPHAELFYLANSSQWLSLALYSVAVDAADLLYLYVDPAHREKKLGHQTLTSSLSILKKMGVERIFLEVRVSNTAAIKLYQSLPMQVTSTRARYYSNGEDALCMAADLKDIEGLD